MKIVAMVGGLGAQVMQYMFFLSLQMQQEGEEVVIDTSCFDYLEVWNGYELEKVFGIRLKDIWHDVRKTENAHSGNYRDAVMHYCYSRIDKKSCFYIKGKKYHWTKLKDILYISGISTAHIFQIVKKARWYWKHIGKKSERQCDEYPDDYMKQGGITYYDDFCYVSDKYLYKDKAVLRNVFGFPVLDERNRVIADRMCLGDSVALHVRRSDHMYDNASLFSRGYFQDTVQYMKSSLEKPCFYIFSEDMEWCRNHLRELGIEKNDEYVMIDWNKGSASYRDMQLMTYCKNNILVMSSFSWCGYYLSVHEEKMVIAPHGWWLEVPIHM